MPEVEPGGPRSFFVRTIGCQMNAHDSERIAGQMVGSGYRPVATAHEADVVIINTCAVRENADNRLYGNLGHLRDLKRRRPGLAIAVGGCLAQKDQIGILERAPWVDVVFGTHNLDSLAHLLDTARLTGEPQAEFRTELGTFPSELPASRSSAFSAWVAVSVGCNNNCTYCIVPSLRGRQRDRTPAEIRGEIERLVSSGVIEVTLLGQNVNSYGVDAGDSAGFGKLLRACGGIDGLLRVRFASPHPRDFRDDVIAAMAETENVMPAIHLPLQSGSDRVLARMRRSYRSDRFLELVGRLRDAIPGVAITTDVIVGFPGETEEDFRRTLAVVEAAGFAGAYTFKYSPRPGTAAAAMPDQVSAEVVGMRYERLVAAVDASAWDQGRALVGSAVEIMVSDEKGKKDSVRERVSGRTRDNRLVHIGAASTARPGDLVIAEITYAAPHHLVSDAPRVVVVPTAGGDAWERARNATVAAPTRSEPSESGQVDLGMPTVLRVQP